MVPTYINGSLFLVSSQYPHFDPSLLEFSNALWYPLHSIETHVHVHRQTDRQTDTQTHRRMHAHTTVHTYVTDN